MGRVPFPLSQRFRGMLHRGIDLGSLDVSYISSLSYYVLMWSGKSVAARTDICVHHSGHGEIKG